jgi:uncharacterized protein YbgA (DUF1722 family)/uncharacterized protein YbbK (DUF523 family)
MRKFNCPNIVVSKCLGFEAVRYNGAIIFNDFIEKLKSYVNFVSICPEMEIGLGTPREPIRIVISQERLKLIQPSTGQDLTDKMNRFSSKFLKSLKNIDGFILKSRSPSCGIKDVKIHSEKENIPSIGKGAGFFGGKVLDLHANCAIEDEGRLLNLKIREHFLTKIFAFTKLRETIKSGSMRQLVLFHAQNKLLLMAHNQKELRNLGKIVANHDRNKFEMLAKEYDEHFRLAITRPARDGANINVFMHALGYFSDELTSREKKYFLKTLEDFRKKKAVFATISGIVKAWIVRFENEYLQSQSFFYPYPEELIEIIDTGRGREI